jgi:HEAT repeat protein
MHNPQPDPAVDPEIRQQVIGLLVNFHTFERGVHDQALQQLKAMNRSAAINALSDLSNSPDGDVRADVAEALVHIDRIGTLQLVLPLLNDPDSGVRRNVCELLACVRDTRSIQPLAKLVLEDPNPTVRWWAAAALGDIGDLSALPALRHAAEFDDGTEAAEDRRVRDIAAQAIDEILSRNRSQPGEQ